MNYKISFQERAQLATEILSKQSPVTLEQARKQAQWLKKESSVSTKKKKNIAFADSHDVWVENIDFSQFVSEGAEQRVFILNLKSFEKRNK